MRKRNLLLKLLIVATFVFGVFGLSACDLTDMFHSHSWQAWIVDQEATCETEGLKHRICASCGDAEEMPIHPLGHDIAEYTYNEDATCAANGTKSGTCARENCQKYVTVEATNTKLAHEYVQMAMPAYLKKAATCTSKSVYYISCSCGEMSDNTFEYGEMLDHVYDREIVSDAFFISSEICEGDYYYKSCKCGATSDEIFVDTKSVEHLWDDGKLTKEPSKDKSEDGEICYHCTNCPEEETKPMKPDDDQDEDGLSNWEEIWDYDCDPMQKDSDGDKLDDYEEVKDFETDPNCKDTDDDDLDDYEELHGEKNDSSFTPTDPKNPDTDGDEVKDGKEVNIHTDPSKPDDTFDADFGYTPDPDEEEDVVKPSIKVELDKDQANSLKIEKDDFFDKTMLGYMGQAYKYHIEGKLNPDGAESKKEAEITFDFSQFKKDWTDAWIYLFDEVKKVLTPVQDTKVADMKASTCVSELGTYVLIDRYQYENENTGFKAWVDYLEMGETETVASAVQIVFVVDDSGSMQNNDPLDSSTNDYERLRVARELVDGLPKNSQIGVVKFGEAITLMEDSFTSDRTVVNSYLQSTQNQGAFSNSEGRTYMHQAIWKAFDLFENASTTDNVMKLMIILSDGAAHDGGYNCTYNGASGYYRDLVPQRANDEGIQLYTVGLGSASSSYFEEQLKPLSENTNAEFYLAANAGELSEIYKKVSITVDLMTDSDGDGLIDHYEKNPVAFDGVEYGCDPTLKDTDGDGLKDGDEVVVVKILSWGKDEDGNVVIGEKMVLVGRVFSNPRATDSDNDGVDDAQDLFPMDSSLS